MQTYKVVAVAGLHITEVLMILKSKELHITEKKILKELLESFYSFLALNWLILLTR